MFDLLATAAIFNLYFRFVHLKILSLDHFFEETTQFLYTSTLLVVCAIISQMETQLSRSSKEEFHCSEKMFSFLTLITITSVLTVGKLLCLV